jgi:uncharacterized protein YjbI with pentapeptide repeats
MADAATLSRLRDGSATWNAWRGKNRHARIDLSGAELSRADLRLAELSGADLSGARLRGARLIGANLAGATLADCDFRQANLGEARLDGVNAVCADFTEANMRWARFEGANLTRARFYGADLTGSILSRAQMFRADLRWANMAEIVCADANLTDADLYHADLRGACLHGVDLTQARLDLATFADGEIEGCHIYGVSAWDVKLDGTHQADLVITQPGEPVVAIDDLDAAQFVNLLLHSPSLRSRIETISTRMALVLIARSPRGLERIARLRGALAIAGWMAIQYDVGAPAPDQARAMIDVLSRICGVVVADLHDVAPFWDHVAAALERYRRPLVPLVPEPGFDPATVVDIAACRERVLPALSYDSLDRIADALPRRGPQGGPRA